MAKKKISRRAKTAPYLSIGCGTDDKSQYFLAGFAAFLLLLWMMPYWTGMGLSDYLYAKLDFLTIPMAAAEADSAADDSAYVSLFEAVDQDMVAVAISPRLTAVAGAQIASSEQSDDSDSEEAGQMETGKLAKFVSSSVVSPLKVASSQVFAGVVPEVPGGAFSIAAFGDAAYDVFDISEQVEPWVELARPPASAVWNAWLELMADPQFN